MKGDFVGGYVCLGIFFIFFRKDLFEALLS